MSQDGRAGSTSGCRGDTVVGRGLGQQPPLGNGQLQLPQIDLQLRQKLMQLLQLFEIAAVDMGLHGDFEPPCGDVFNSPQRQLKIGLSRYRRRLAHPIVYRL